MGTVTFLFLDEPGDGDASPSRRGVLAGDVLAAVRACITAWGGHELDLTVDGLGVVFPSAAAGVASARAMQRAVRTLNGGGPGALRVGVHTGEPLAIPGGRYFGAAVWLAARLHKRAAPGQILVSDTVFELLDATGRARCTPVGSLDLKGLSDRVVAFDASWSDAGMPADVDVAGLRTVTLMTVDQVGSTAQIDTLGDESARAIHAALLDVLREAIGDHGGREVEYTGDGLTAMFDAALDATGCAVAMQQAAYRHRLRYPSEQGLALRVGIQSAEAVAENRDSWTGTAQQAGALCSAAGNGEIVVSRLVRAIAAPRRIHVFEPFAEAEAPARDDGARFLLRWEPELSEFSLPADLVAKLGQFGFVGRHDELERLVRLWADARAGEPRVALVSGGAGIGKSSLAAHFAEIACEGASTIVLYGACRLGPRDDYEPFADALAQYVSATSRADLRRQVGAHAPVLASVIPGLAARLPDVPGEVATGDAEVAAVGRAIEAFVAAIAQTAPVLLVIDDLQNAAASTLRVLRQVATTGGSVALMVVGLFRDPVAGRSPVLDALGVDPARRDQTEHLVIEGLSDDDVAVLVEAVTHVAPSALTRDAIAAQSDGVPYAVVESARSQMEQGVTSDLRRAIEQADHARLDRRELREEIARGVLEIQRLRQPLAALPEIAAGSVDRDGTPPAPGPCPYRGLESFKAGDVEWFFGREQLVAELVAHVAGSKLVGVIGASGSGKSSLVRAGLVPALDSGALPGAEQWLSLVMTPTARPRQSLALACAASGRISGEAARDLLEGSELAPLVERLVGSAGERVVLVVDQCEELFIAASEEERERFVDMIVGAAADPGVPITLILVLRADFYGACAQYPGLADRLEDSQVLVGAMSADEIRRTIELPARHAGLVLESGFADAVIADVSGEPGGLPLLSTALLETWARRRGRSLTLAAYAETGGVRSAVARLADSVYDGLDPADRDIARRMLLRLARPGSDDTVGDVRRRAPLGELVADDPAAQRVLGRLVERRLVTTDEHTAEVAHEAVLREWPQLREWLDDDREGRRIHHQLADATHEWESAARDPEHLYRGARLAAAVDYATMHAADLNPLEHEFLAAGRARATAELDASQRSARRFRRLTAGLVVILVVALIAGSFALIQREDARSQRNTARTQRDRATQQARLANASRLATVAVSGAPDDLSRSALLAIEANRLDDNAQTRGAILSVAEDAAPVREIIHGSWETAAMSADGRTVATVGARGISIVDLKTRRSRSISRRNFSGIRSVSFSSDGKLLALGGNDVEILDAHSGAPARAPFRFTDQTGPGRTLVVHVRFNPDGSSIAAIDNNGGGYLWSLANGAELAHFATGSYGSGSSNVVFSPDGKWLTLTDSHAVVYSAHSFRAGQLEPRYRAQPYVGFSEFDVAFSPDGNRFAAATGGGQILFRDSATGAEVGPAISTGTGVGRLAFSPDGTAIAGTRAGRISVWDTRESVGGSQSGELLDDTLLGGTRATVALSYAPDGALVVLTTAEIVVLDPPARLGTFIAPSSPIRGYGIESLAAAPDGRSIAAADGLGRVRVWDLASGTLERTINATTPAESAQAVAYQPGTGTIVVGSGDGTVTAWDPRTGRQIHSPLRLTPPSVPVNGNVFSPGDGVFSVAFDAGGRTLVAATGDGRVVVIDPRTWKVRRTIHLVKDVIESTSTLAISPDGNTVALGATGVVEVSDIDGTHRRQVNVGPFAIETLALAPNGSLLAAGLEDGRVVLANLATAHGAGTIVSNHGGAIALAFDAKGTTLAVGGDDGDVTLWSVADRQAVGPPLSSSQSLGISGLAFSPDGNSLFAAAGDLSVVRYDLRPTEQIERLCALIGRNLSRAERETYLADPTSGSQTCPQWPAGT